MKKIITKIIFVLFAFGIFSCKNTVFYQCTYCRKLDSKSLSILHRQYHVDNIEKEGLLFLMNFGHDSILIKNGDDTVCVGKLKTNASLGLSKVVKFERDKNLILYNYSDNKHLKIKTREMVYPNFVFI